MMDLSAVRVTDSNELTRHQKARRRQANTREKKGYPHCRGMLLAIVGKLCFFVEPQANCCYIFLTILKSLV